MIEKIAFLQIIYTTLLASSLIGLGIITSKFLRPNRPSRAKSTLYECGIPSTNHLLGGLAYKNLYVIGIIFLLFEVETLLLLPYFIIYSPASTQPSSAISFEAQLYMLGNGTLFILLLGIGFIYVIKYIPFLQKNPKKENPIRVDGDKVGHVPMRYYNQINDLYAPLNTKKE